MGSNVIQSQPPRSWRPMLGIEACNCNFGSGLCNWTSSGIHKWVRHTGSTRSGGTGPPGAHEGNYYAYVEVWCGGPGWGKLVAMALGSHTA